MLSLFESPTIPGTDNYPSVCLYINNKQIDLQQANQQDRTPKIITIPKPPLLQSQSKNPYQQERKFQAR